jgi:superfamily II DNA or RNA helicase
LRPPHDRPYQRAAHDAIWDQFDRGAPSTLAVLPTGTGKTHIAANCAQTARSRGLRTLFLAHREILVNQARDTLEAHGLEVAVEMGGQDARAQSALFGDADVVVATVQTLQGDRLRRWDRRHFGHLIVDECHRAAAKEHRNVIDWFRAVLLGITATPDGSSGEIGNVFQSLAYHYPMRDAVKDGWLKRPVHERCKVSIDLRNLSISAGDYNNADLAERIAPHVEYIADAIKQRIGERFAVCFTPTVASALALAQALGCESPSGPGCPAHYVSGDHGRFGMPRSQRHDVLARFDRGEFRVLVCCDLLFEGWDADHVGAVVIARPTLQRYRYAQMVGRGTRPCPDLAHDDCLVVDFDWRTDGEARNLITPVELFTRDDADLLALGDDDARRRVAADARRIMDAGEKDPLAALEHAKAANLRRQGLPLILTGARAEFETITCDPLGVAGVVGVTLRKRGDLWRPEVAGFERARDWQCAKLRALGVDQPEKLTFFGAMKLWRALEKRKTEGLAGHGQVRELLRLGVGEVTARSMSAAQASAVIRELRGV